MTTIDAMQRLERLAPNTLLNSRCPWKGDKRTTRMWCPCHAGAWVRLLVRSERGDVVLMCEGGCSQGDIELFIFDAGAPRQNGRWRPRPEPTDYPM